eukprot:scaffold54081_cov20-Cyclotella_meneghiniana.AAC.1
MREREMRKQSNNTVCAIIYTQHPNANPPKPKQSQRGTMSDSDSSSSDVPLSVLAPRCKRERELHSPIDSLPKMEPHSNEEDKENTDSQHVFSLGIDHDTDANKLSVGKSDPNMEVSPPKNNATLISRLTQRNRLKLGSRKRRQKEQERKWKKKQGQPNDATASNSTKKSDECASLSYSAKNTHSNGTDTQQKATIESPLEPGGGEVDRHHFHEVPNTDNENNLSQQMQSVRITKEDKWDSTIIDSCSDEHISHSHDNVQQSKAANRGGIHAGSTHRPSIPKFIYSFSDEHISHSHDNAQQMKAANQCGIIAGSTQEERAALLKPQKDDQPNMNIKAAKDEDC